MSEEGAVGTIGLFGLLFRWLRIALMRSILPLTTGV